MGPGGEVGGGSAKGRVGKRRAREGEGVFIVSQNL